MSFVTSISSGSTHTSIFSHENEDYDARIKEIEEYYIKTLLADDNDAEVASSDDCTSGKQRLGAGVFGLQPEMRVDPGLWGASAILDAPAFGNGNYIMPSSHRERCLEVEINSQYRPANGVLPLTTENLALMEAPLSGMSQSPAPVAAQQKQQQQQQQQLSQQQPEKVNKTLYKTELCESFAVTGFCKYREKCQFAHGLQELKFKERSNKFRTKPCANWSKTGYCRYGKRCCFKHGDDEDIKVYMKAGLIKVSNDHSNMALQKKQNLHANVKILQTMTW